MTIKIGARKFQSRRTAAQFLLKNRKLTQTEIARRLKVTPARICQIAHGQ